MTLMHFIFVIVFPLTGPVCCGIASATLVWPSRMGRAAKIAATAAILICSMKFTWFAAFGKHMFQPELPGTFIHMLSIAYDVVLMLAAFGIMLSAVRLVRKLLRHLHGGKMPAAPPATSTAIPRRDFLLGSLAAISAPCATAAVHAGIRLPRVIRLELRFQDLPPAFDSYRIVQLSDIHVSSAALADRTAGIVAIANGLSPDLIVITGDIVDGKVNAHLSDVEPLAGLKAKDGVLGCTGNHEYFRDCERWSIEFDRLGIRMLKNESTVIRRTRADGTADEIAIIGKNDPISRNTDIRAALRSAPPFRILLFHRPAGLAEHSALGIRLQLSGHTHGGAILGIDRLVAMANEGHVRGLYREHGMTLYVSAGTGQWAGFPERVGVPSEITEITLRRA